MTLASLRARVAKTIDRYHLLGSGERVVVGVSGGADSLVLLHILHAMGRWRLHVATLDHGTRGADGAADAAFVRQTAAGWGLPVTVGQADVPAFARDARRNLEEVARQFRYTFLLRIARQIGAAAVAVAHHQDDQAETVLMHLIRGSGLDGLCGMPPAVPLSALALPYGATITFDPPFEDAPTAPDLEPILIRPLLDLSRAEIDAYATEHALNPRHDATNDDLSYFRNRLRHEIIPLLSQLNPNLHTALARTADVLREDAVLLHQTGEAALHRTIHDSQAGFVALDRARWRVLSLAEKRYALRTVLARLRPSLRDLSFEHIEHACQVADAGKTGAMAILPGGLALRVDYETLVIADRAAPPDLRAPALPPGDEPRTFTAGDSIRWQFGAWTFEVAPLAAGADLDAIHADPLQVALAVPAGTPMTLRGRLSGDRFLPRGLGGHSQKLSDTLINMRVPQAFRDQVPLLLAGNRLAWFVAPTADQGIRGRVAEPFALPPAGAPTGTISVVARWKKAKS